MILLSSPKSEGSLSGSPSVQLREYGDVGEVKRPRLEAAHPNLMPRLRMSGNSEKCTSCYGMTVILVKEC